MAEPYTPTEDEVRATYAYDESAPYFLNAALAAEFDRFLAQVRAEARREGAVEALREAADETLRIDPHWDSALWLADKVWTDGVGDLRTGQYVPVPDWLRDRADRIEAEG
ncbi:hypothetical protein ACFT5B_06870 [Luteimicrobium sp. NPDC057192]|uniref:hypothetical protein n=1 Tax=Luteimicrobium sp. NPDC057192 TaxID=3346042 RepID=UPI0036430BE7